MVPWNFPVMLEPRAPHRRPRRRQPRHDQALRVHPSHQRRAALLLDEALCGDEVVVIEGDAGIAAAFSALPFDHLIFTGSTAVGRLVMAAAAPSSPLTLGSAARAPVSSPRHAPGPGGGADDLRQTSTPARSAWPPTCCCRGGRSRLHRGLSGPFSPPLPQRAREPRIMAPSSTLPSTSGSPPGWKRARQAGARPTPRHARPG